jgi:hypothetical protein
VWTNVNLLTKEESTPQDDFKTFYREVGIRRELTTPYNPQQNGVAERKNRSIEESIKAMMNDQNLSMFLWGEATMTTVYVQNRSPHHILKNMTPEEAFSGKKPSVEHLRIFGCQSRRKNGRKL